MDHQKYAFHTMFSNWTKIGDRVYGSKRTVNDITIMKQDSACFVLPT
jgi:hypothetical protein